jgi:hypothetical protein
MYTNYPSSVGDIDIVDKVRASQDYAGARNLPRHVLASRCLSLRGYPVPYVRYSYRIGSTPVTYSPDPISPHSKPQFYLALIRKRLLVYS